MKTHLWGVVILLFLSACSQDSVLQGISQDSSKDATIEQARIDLDNSNYDQVISDLSTIYTTQALDPEVGQLLASAYMGKAGIDLTIFIANSTSSGLNPFDAVSSMISSNVTVDGEARYIASSLMPNILGYILSAEEPLQVMSKQGLADPDDIIQLGIASAAHFIMFMGNATKLDNMPINTAAFKASDLKNVGPRSFVVITTSAGITTIHRDLSYQKDLINIKNAIIAFSNAYPKPNEMRDRLNDFLNSALFGTSAGITVTDELIMNFTSEGLNNYVHRLAK